jgi:hypothetical protein
MAYKRLKRKIIQMVIDDREKKENELHKAILKMRRITDRTMVKAGFAKSEEEAVHIMLQMEIKYLGNYGTFHDGSFFWRKGEKANCYHQEEH